jgi:tetratricopeptide (TPR) repeat protein
MFLRFAIVGGGLFLLAVIPVLADVVSSTSSKRGVLHCIAGEELLAAGWLVPAEREFRRALRQQPLLGAAHCGLGKIRMQEERYADAVAEFQAAISAIETLDDELGNSLSTIPETLTLALADALDRSGRPMEASEAPPAKS